MIGSFFNIFKPRDRVFFHHFEASAANVLRMSEDLMAIMNTSPGAQRAAILERLEQQEHANDDLTHTIFTDLARNFITPIDREDIHQLAVRLDDVIDLIDGTVRRLALFKIEKPTPLSQTLSKLIVSTTGELVEAVSQLRRQKGVMERCIRIKQLENEADVVYHGAIASLFIGDLPAIEVIKWKDVYDNMERSVDSCVAVAHVLESVVLKHS